MPLLETLSYKTMKVSLPEGSTLFQPILTAGAPTALHCKGQRIPASSGGK